MGWSVARRRAQHKGRGAKSQPAGGRLRIIGGRWRGTRLPIPDIDGLRPTGDRLRETLFNWLAPWLAGARCLDLFAGTGALGLEAASRGAAHVVLLERDPRAVAAIKDTLSRLDDDRVRIERANALSWMAGCDESGFDLVFIDPPFGADLHGPVLAVLAEGSLLAAGARIYVEMDRDQALAFPPEWSVERDAIMGQVRALLLRSPPAEGSGDP